MNASLYLQVFQGAAPPQKLLFLVFVGTGLFSLAYMAARVRRAPHGRGRVLQTLGWFCPMLGVLCAALNGLHMMRTVERLPITVTAQMLAPGVVEMSALVMAGTLAGLMAIMARSGGEQPLGGL